MIQDISVLIVPQILFCDINNNSACTTNDSSYGQTSEGEQVGGTESFSASPSIHHGYVEKVETDV